MNSNEEVIRKLAHQIWEAEGKPEGQANQHWSRASVLVAHDSGQAKLKKSIDPSEATGPTEPAQPDQT